MGFSLPTSLSLPLLSLLLLSLLSLPIPSLSTPSAQDQLESHGLPRGLLPPTVKSYILNDDGSFTVKLSSSCYTSVKAGTIKVYYASTLSGVLQMGRLGSLKGISVQPPQTRWLWIQVSNIYVDSPSSNMIHFGSALGLQEALDLEEFSQPRVCDKAAAEGWGEAWRSVWAWIDEQLQIDW